MQVATVLSQQEKRASLPAFALKKTWRTALRKHSSGFIIGIIVSIVLGFGIIAGVWLGLRSAADLGYDPGIWHAQKTGSNTATLDISVYPDSHVCHASDNEPQIDWVTYCPSTSFVVPPNSTVTIVIHNYDGATTLVNDYYSKVRGTVGGTALYNDKPMNQLDGDKIAHTFTLQSRPNEANPLFASVPILAVADDAPTPVTIEGNSYPKPNTISFQIQTGPAGTYIWHCYDPCGADRQPPFGFTGAMSTTGFMAGTLTVASY